MHMVQNKLTSSVLVAETSYSYVVSERGFNGTISYYTGTEMDRETCSQVLSH